MKKIYIFLFIATGVLLTSVWGQNHATRMEEALNGIGNVKTVLVVYEGSTQSGRNQAKAQAIQGEIGEILRFFEARMQAGPITGKGIQKVRMAVNAFLKKTNPDAIYIYGAPFTTKGSVSFLVKAAMRKKIPIIGGDSRFSKVGIMISFDDADKAMVNQKIADRLGVAINLENMTDPLVN